MIFFNSSRETTLASHDAVIRPDLSGYVVLLTGPVLPDVRVPTDQRIGVSVTLGKTDAPSTSALIDRYALIASQPQGPQARVQEVLGDMMVDSLVRGAALGLVPIVVWVLVGQAATQGALRARPAGARRSIALVLSLVVIGVAVAQPWGDDEETLDSEEQWQPLATFLGPDVPLPEELDRVEVRGDVTTEPDPAADRERGRHLRRGQDVLPRRRRGRRRARAAPAGGGRDASCCSISDRHDNIGMDRVARAVGDAAGAEAVFDAGDDTSTGSTWEAFSLDSLDAAFDDGPYADSKWAVTGNHDHGAFVGSYLADHGWTVLDGRGGRRPGRRTPARRRRPALQRPRQLARRDRAELRRGRRPAGRRGLPGRGRRRPDHHDPGPRRQHGRRGAWSAAAPTWWSAATCTSRAAPPR